MNFPEDIRPLNKTAVDHSPWIEELWQSQFPERRRETIDHIQEELALFPELTELLASEVISDGTRTVVFAALGKIYEDYEAGDEQATENPPLYYHRVRHTLRVMNRTRKIVAAFNAIRNAAEPIDPNYNLQLAASHDAVILTEQKTDPTIPTITRASLRPDSEEASAVWLHQMLEKQGLGQVPDRSQILADIKTTAVDFQQIAGNEHWSVIQTRVDENTSRSGRILALADMADRAMNPPEQFKKMGDALFKESQYELSRKIRAQEGFSGAEIAHYSAAIKNWKAAQVHFVQDGKHFYEENVLGFSPEEMTALHGLTGYRGPEDTNSIFDQNIRATTATYEAIADEDDFKALLVAIGYDIRADYDPNIPDLKADSHYIGKPA